MRHLFLVLFFWGGLFEGLAETPRLLWSYRTGNYVFSSPAVGDDGTIYIGSADDKLYAFNTNGTVKWSFTTGEEIQSSPAIARDGTIYFGSGDSYIYALNPDGTQKWRFKTGDLTINSPAIGANGTIYIGSRDKRFYAINPDGTKRWEFVTGDYYTDKPAVIGPDGTIYFSGGSKMYAVNPDGKLKWEQVIGGYVGAAMVIGKKGILYVNTSDQKLIAMTHRGERLWVFQFGDATVAGIACYPAIGNDGTLYVASSDSFLYAINPDGTEKWKVPATRSQSSPALSSDGKIYLNSDWDFRLLCYSTNGTQLWQYLFSSTGGTSGFVSSFPTIVDGKIYVGSGNRKVYALSATGDLDGSEWPAYGRNRHHTGRDTQRGLAVVTEGEEKGKLQLTLDPGRSYTLQGSTNLIHWQDETNFVATNSLQYISPPASGDKMYRLATP